MYWPQDIFVCSLKFHVETGFGEVEKSGAIVDAPEANSRTVAIVRGLHSPSTDTVNISAKKVKSGSWILQ